jgi:hypothetical protein
VHRGGVPEVVEGAGMGFAAGERCGEDGAQGGGHAGVLEHLGDQHAPADERGNHQGGHADTETREVEAPGGLTEERVQDPGGEGPAVPGEGTRSRAGRWS